MRQLLAVIALGFVGLGWSMATSGSTVRAMTEANTFAHRLAQIERAVRALPCVLAPPDQKGCAPASA